MGRERDACDRCNSAANCQREGPVLGRNLCATYLQRAIGLASLELTLASLQGAGVIRGFTIDGNTVTLDADLTALECWLSPEVAMEGVPASPVSKASRYDALGPSPGSRSALGDDVERGFTVSSDIEATETKTVAGEEFVEVGSGRRGGSVAQAADFAATDDYFRRAEALFSRRCARRLTSRQRHLWAMHCRGDSERKIAGWFRISGRQVRKELDHLRRKAGITRRK